MEKTSIDLSQLDESTKQALLEQLKQEQAKKQESLIQKKEHYAAMRDEMIAKAVSNFREQEQAMTDLKNALVSDIAALVDIKTEAFGETEQKGHTFTNKDGTMRVKTSEAEILGFDDTALNGVAKIKTYIKGLASENNQELIEMILRLLKPDKEGNLNPREVVKLFNYKDELEAKLSKQGKQIDPVFSEGVEIIRQAKKVDRKAYYIEVLTRENEKGKWRAIRLNFANI